MSGHRDSESDQVLDDFYGRVVDICRRPTKVTQLKDLSEDLTSMIEENLPVLEQWPRRILASAHGSTEHFGLLTGWRYALGTPDSTWIPALYPKDDLASVSQSRRFWDQMCPPSLAHHLETFPVELVERDWLNVLTSTSIAVGKMVDSGHPAWDNPRQSEWAIALMGGLRPTFAKGNRNRIMERLFASLLPLIKDEQWHRIKEKGLLPAWQKAWSKSPEIMAVWRDWRARNFVQGPDAVPIRPRVRP